MMKHLTIAPALATLIPSAAIGADKIEKEWTGEYDKEEWDWPPRRRWKHYPSRFDVYEPSDWCSPITRKITDIIWRVMFTIIKAMFITVLAVLAFAGSWLFFTAITLLFK